MTLILLFVTTALIAFIRKNNLKKFFIESLKLLNPTPGDYFMDVLTGGGLGDLIRKIFLGKKQIIVRNPLLILLGFRRLLYNPFSPNYKEYILNKNSSTKTLHRK